jgi:hypothetical protein
MAAVERLKRRSVFLFAALLFSTGAALSAQTPASPLSGLKVLSRSEPGLYHLFFYASDTADVHVNIANARGNSLYEEVNAQFSGEYLKELDLRLQDNGVYFVQITSGRSRLVKKILLEK